jgi:hypothetical protein
MEKGKHEIIKKCKVLPDVLSNIVSEYCDYVPERNIVYDYNNIELHDFLNEKITESELFDIFEKTNKKQNGYIFR